MAIVRVINLCRCTATKIIQINQTKTCELNLWSLNVKSALDYYFIGKVHLTLIYKLG